MQRKVIKTEKLSSSTEDAPRLRQQKLRLDQSTFNRARVITAHLRGFCRHIKGTGLMVAQVFTAFFFRNIT
jgi:hypothetical protein